MKKSNAIIGLVLALGLLLTMPTIKNTAEAQVGSVLATALTKNVHGQRTGTFLGGITGATTGRFIVKRIGGTIGKIIGTAVAPGVGTAVGGAIGVL